MPRSILCLMLAFGLLSCNDGVRPNDETSGLVANLIRSVKFPNAMLVNEPLPDARGPTAMLLPIGGTTVFEPNGSGLMSLEVDDDENRPISATLVQFDDGSEEAGAVFVRVPVDGDQQASNVIENPFDVDSAVCEALCDGVFALQVLNAIEFANGDVTDTVARQVILDCRQSGDHEACDDFPTAGDGDGDGDGDGAPSDAQVTLVPDGVLCGSIAARELIFTGAPRFDGYFDAVSQLGIAVDQAEQGVTDTLEDLADLLGAADSDAASVASALESELAANTEMGLSVQLGEIGCGIRSAEVRGALLRCDTAAGKSFEGTDCAGDCRLDRNNRPCTGASEARCRGLVEDFECSGTCTGACTDMLAMAAVCQGTCEGTCSGACPDDGDGGCLGPCEGECSGECRELSADTCDGLCTGLCDGSTGASDPCDEGAVRFCVAPDDEPLECPGACFGDTSLPDVDEDCGIVPLTLGRIYPLCEPTLVQVSFAFLPGIDIGAQTSFAQLADAFNTPLRRLYEALDRIELLAQAASDLAGEGRDTLESELADADEQDSAVECQMRELPDAITSADDDLTRLSDRTSDVNLVLDMFLPPMP